MFIAKLYLAEALFGTFFIRTDELFCIYIQFFFDEGPCLRNYVIIFFIGNKRILIYEDFLWCLGSWETLMHHSSGL